jgi:hypothetical protein
MRDVPAVEQYREPIPAGVHCMSRHGEPKRAYPSRAVAKANAQKYHRVYQCPSCGLWHRTSAK